MSNEEQELLDYVAKKFGESVKGKMQRIRTGGDSNYKGNIFESYFHLFKIFEIAASESCEFDKHFIHAQALGFIDDLVHINAVTNERFNYQAKNSENSVSDWNDDVTDRVKKQIDIDKEFHQAKNSYNYLLVSSEKKYKNNQSKIPKELSASAYCIHFPETRNFVELIDKTEIGKHVSTLINDVTPSNIAYAMNLIYGCMHSHQNQSLEEIFKKAECHARPNIFKAFKLFEEAKKLPIWLIEILERFNVNYHFYDDNLQLETQSGFKVNTPLSKLEDLTIDEISSVIDVKSLFKLCMSKMAQDLDLPVT